MKELKDNRGFTLIELLAVIVIMAILLMTAIPTINAILFSSRANMYIQSAKTFVQTALNLVTDGTFDAYDFDTTYYIHINNLSEQKPSPSPFADWNDAYVVVVHNLDDSYDYYWVSADRAGWRIDLTIEDKIDKNSVYQGKKAVNNRQPIGGRKKILIYDSNGYAIEAMPYHEMTREEAKKCYSFKDISDTEIMLSYYNKDCGGDVVVPAKVDGKEVTSIYQYTFNNMGITSVYIPDTVKSIGSRAFAYNKLTTLYIPSSVQQISSEAFLSNKLASLTIDEGIKSIGARAFKTNQLTKAVVPATVTSLGACSYCENPIPNPSFLYVQSGGVTDYSRIRGYIGDLTEFSDKVFRIPPVAVDESGNSISLTRIESGAFSSMNLYDWEVVIPNTVTVIADSAFSFCNIRKVNLPAGLKVIGGSAFYNNELRTLEIPSSVTRIDSMAFNRNQVSDVNQAWIYKRTESGIDYSTIIGYAGANRTNLTIPEMAAGQPLTTINDSALKYLNLKGTIKIPRTVKTIGSLAFSLNELTNVDNGDGILEGPFVYARTASGDIDRTILLSYAGFNTNHVTVPSQVKVLAPYSFYYTYIKDVTLPEGLVTIGNYSFNLCKLSGTVTIPSTVKTIGIKAFQKEITWDSFNAGLTKIVNKTGRSFDWQAITGGPSSATFEYGTVENWYGDIEIVTG